MAAERSGVRRGVAATAVALAVIGVVSGCGAVDHSAAGGAADGGPEPTFVPVTTAPDGSGGGGGESGAAGGSAGGGAAAGRAGGSGGPGAANGGVNGGANGGVNGGGGAGSGDGGAAGGGSAGGGSAGGGAGGSAGSGGSSGGGGSGTTAPEVSDRDRSLVAFCSGVFDFQKTGLKLLTTSSIDPASVGVVAVDFRRKFELAALAAPGDIAAELGPMLSALQQAVPTEDVRLPAVLIADLNRALASADAALGRAFGAMSRVCPRQVPADTVDQYRTFQLGAPVPEEFVAAVFGIKPI